MSPSPWLASLQASRARRFAANRARRRRWCGRAGAGTLLASLSLAAGGALAAGGSGGATPASSQTAASPIAAAQRALGITADGVAGPRTRRAVRRFQRAHGLTVDGALGPATLAALGVSTPAPASADRSLSATSSAGPATELAKIAQCESGGNPTAVSAGGRYRGKYQFSRATWRALGGHGDPAKAPEVEQDRRAGQLLAARGTSPWPNCA